MENAVGFLRRNLMVPEPEACSLPALNKVLLARGTELAAAEHWRKEQSIRELFDQDVGASLALPGVAFDSVRYEARRADKTGNVLVDANTYAAGPAFASRRLTVGLRHDVVQILDEHSEPVVVFDRVFGRQEATVFEPATLLPYLLRKPGAWGHSPLRGLVPDPLKAWLDEASTAQRRSRLLNWCP